MSRDVFALYVSSLCSIAPIEVMCDTVCVHVHFVRVYIPYL